MRRWITRYPLFCFCAASAVWLAVLYSGVLSAPFIYDDLDEVVNNTALQSWHEVYAHLLRAPVVFTSGFIGSGGSMYRPLFWISLALDRHLWGLEPSGFHFTSLALHWLNGLVLFQLLRRFRLSPLVSGLTGLIWLGLPVNSEVVAWIGARAYLLSTACLLAALHAALSYVRGRSRLSLPAFAAFAILAVFSHEQGVLLIGLLALCCWIESGKISRQWITLGALALLADALYASARFAVHAHGGAGARTLWAVGPKFWEYVQLIVLPVHMSMERSSAVPADAPSPTAFVAWVALLGMIAAVWLLRKRAPVTAAGLAVVLLGLLPYCGFTYIYQGMAERFTYLAGVGFVLAVVAGCRLAEPHSRRILLGCVGVWVGWGAWRLMTRVGDWQQATALYRHSLEATPRSAYLQEDLGVVLRDSGDQDGALSALETAVQLRPDYAVAITAIADIHAAQGRLPQAVQEYRRSLALDPTAPKAILNYAAALQQTGQPAEAEEQYRRVMQLAPRDPAAYVDLESLYIQQGRLDDAIAMYKQAVAVDPSDSDAYFDLGVMFQQRGQDREALAFYKKVLQLKPGDEQTLFYMRKLQVSGP